MKCAFALLVPALPLLFFGCSKPPKQANPASHVVPALSLATKARVSQNMRNGRIPSPSEVAEDAIPMANEECKDFQEQEIPKDWFQGTLTVPEDVSHPEGAKVNIFYYGNINPDSIPTVFFNGGPGHSSHGSEVFLAKYQRLFDLGKKVSVIFLDQRGTGCSSGYPRGRDDATLQRLRLYGTRGIVEDAEALRAKLWPGKPWIASGQSYGGYIVHRYVMLHPEGLRAAFSHEDVRRHESILFMPHNTPATFFC